MGRPKGGSLSTFESSIITKIDQYRPGNEGWSALTIQVELQLEEDLEACKIPSLSSINRYLKENKRIRPRQKRVPLPLKDPVPCDHPHHVWQMDAKGNERVKGLGTVSMVNIKDVFSKTHVMAYPCVFAKPTSHPTRLHYQTAIRLGWMEFGMNERLQVDHESVFYDNNSASPFPTKFHLWSLGMNMDLFFTPLGRPQKQGIVEKSHQTLHTQVIAGRSYESEKLLFKACQQRRQRLNYHIPSTSTNNQAPLAACPSAKHSGQEYDPKKEENIFQLDLIYDFLAKGKWFRPVASNQTISLGNRVYYLPGTKPKTEVEITFNKESKLFCFADANGHCIVELKPKGLSFKELAGDLDDFIHWAQKNPHIQYPKKTDTTF